MANTKVSVIVPVCNVKPYLKRCIESLVNQTLSDIEIICVDDCSTDGSDKILRELARTDSRIKTIFHKTNMSTSQSRKDAVAVSTGEYIMFLDSDDEFTPDACEVAYYAIKEKRVDILQFNTQVINCSGVPESRIHLNERMLRPYTRSVIEGNLVSECWENKRFRFTLWNKIYSGDIVRKAFSYIKDGSFPKAQDLYAFFLIAHFSKSYAGIPRKLYKYSFGTGVTGKSSLSIPQFEVILTEKRVAEALKCFVKEQNLVEYTEIVENISMDLAGDCANNWVENIPKRHKDEALELLIKTWGYETIVFALARARWSRTDIVASCFMDTPYLKPSTEKKEIKTIAAYYRCIINGGAQRVVAELCNIWASMKDENGKPRYRVVLITEEGDFSGEEEYPLLSSVERAYLPERKTTTGKNYKIRYEALNKILDQYKIDVIVNSLWMDATAFWDLFAIRAHASKPAYVIHSHSFNCYPYMLSGSNAYSLSQLYKLVDGVVVLSDCDIEYVSVFAKHSKHIINPIFLSPEEVKTSDCQEPVVVWTGRFSKEKQPMDIVRAMRRVIDKIPEAKLYLVGSGDETIIEEINEYIDSYNIRDNIIFTGFSSEVEKYYQKALVYVSASKYEGAPLSFMEAMAHGLPIVSYDLPWLTIARDGRGIISVEQGRPDLMAKELVKLLSDIELSKEIGAQGREQIIEMSTIDIGNEWKEFFDSLYDEVESPEKRSYGNIIISNIVQNQQEGRDKLSSDLREQYQRVCHERDIRGIKIRRLNAENNRLRNSTSYKVGRIITKPFRVVKDFILKIKRRIA